MLLGLGRKGQYGSIWKESVSKKRRNCIGKLQKKNYIEIEIQYQLPIPWFNLSFGLIPLLFLFLAIWWFVISKRFLVHAWYHMVFVNFCICLMILNWFKMSHFYLRWFKLEWKQNNSKPIFDHFMMTNPQKMTVRSVALEFWQLACNILNWY